MGKEKEGEREMVDSSESGAESQKLGQRHMGERERSRGTEEGRRICFMNILFTLYIFLPYEHISSIQDILIM